MKLWFFAMVRRTYVFAESERLDADLATAGLAAAGFHSYAGVAMNIVLDNDTNHTVSYAGVAMSIVLDNDTATQD